MSDNLSIANINDNIYKFDIDICLNTLLTKNNIPNPWSGGSDFFIDYHKWWAPNNDASMNIINSSWDILLKYQNNPLINTITREYSITDTQSNSYRFLNLNNLIKKKTTLFGLGFEWRNEKFVDNIQNQTTTYVIDNINSQKSNNTTAIEKIKSGISGLIAFDNSNSHIMNNFISFTGQHRNKLIIPYKVYLIGLIVESTGKYLNLDGSKMPSINESLPYVQPTTNAKSKSVFGVISNEEDGTDDTRISSFGIFTNVYEKKEPSKRTFINSIGEGAVWIVNTNGNLENGDYIQSSNIMGHGEKQDDDILHNYTVAKITCDCEFELDSEDYLCFEHTNDEGKLYRRAFVGCTYHCG